MKKEEQMPQISVVVPIYNVEEYLEECLGSICKQTLSNIEIICVNDGSTDNSLKIIQKYAKRDKRIVVIDGPNGGYGSAINKGFRAAKGQYISIIESDDFILPTMYEELFRVAEENDHVLDFIKSDMIMFYGDGKAGDRTVIPVTKPEMYNRVLIPLEEPEVFRANMNNSTGIYKTEFIKENSINAHESKGAAFQDNGLWFKFFYYAERIMFINQAFLMYRMDREDSSTNCMSYENAFCIFNEWEYIYKFIKSKEKWKQDKYLPVYTLRCFSSLFYHYTRILDDYRIMYLKKMSGFLNNMKEDNSLKCDYLLPYQSKNLLEIINDPILFFYNNYKKDLFVKYEKEIQKKRNSLNNLLAISNYVEKECARDMCKITVIVPVYNAEKDLQECISSITSQTLKEIEIICIDDGSTDNSLSILLLNQEVDRRIFVITQDNQGAGNARNRGMRLAKGKYIAFMDPDDYYPNENVLEKLYENAVRENAQICGGNIATLENGDIKTDNNEYLGNGFISYKEYQGDYGYTKYIYRTELLRENTIEFPDLRRFQDPPFFIKAMIAAKEFYVIQDVTYVYRFVPSHVVWNEKNVLDLIKGITECLQISKDNNLPQLHFTSFLRLEQSFYSRIVENYNGETSIVRALFDAERAIDISLINQVAKNKICEDKFELKALTNILKLDGLKEKVKRLEKDNEEILLKYQEISESPSYRIVKYLADKIYHPIKRIVKKKKAAK
ncbi:MAG: glycosyltransferase [Lachnospiraceae bacterium]|nr:glycosyltransferase [Lachnospiraceae bacterium]